MCSSFVTTYISQPITIIQMYSCRDSYSSTFKRILLHFDFDYNFEQDSCRVVCIAPAETTGSTRTHTLCMLNNPKTNYHKLQRFHRMYAHSGCGPGHCSSCFWSFIIKGGLYGTETKTIEKIVH